MGGGGGTAERGGGARYFLRGVEEGELLRGEGVQGISSEGWRRGNCREGRGCQVIPQRGGGEGTAEGRGCKIFTQRGGGGGTAERGGGAGYFLRGMEEGNC